MEMHFRTLSVNINNVEHGPFEIPEGIMMVDFLHEYLNLTGTRMACGQGICHACVIIVKEPDGSETTMRTCITGAHFFNGKKVTTIEGIARNSGNPSDLKELSDVQQAFLDHFSFQCGYCAPGFVNSVTVFLKKLQNNPIKREAVEQEIEKALIHHICRCTGYVRYYQAVRELILSNPELMKD